MQGTRLAVVGLAVLFLLAISPGMVARADVPEQKEVEKLIVGKWKAFEGGTETVEFKDGKLTAEAGAMKFTGTYKIAGGGKLIEWTLDVNGAKVELDILDLSKDKLTLKNKMGQTTKYNKQ